MATVQQAKQALELALNLSLSVHSIDTEDREQIEAVIQQINAHFNKLKPLSTPEKSGHPVDTLLKKGKVTLTEGRYKQLVQIYDELMIVMGSVAMPPKGLKFLSAKQNDSLTWFPLDLNGDKSAALYLMAEWEIAPINPKANGVLSGEWEGFDLDQAMEDSDFDQDDY